MGFSVSAFGFRGNLAKHAVIAIMSRLLGTGELEKLLALSAPIFLRGSGPERRHSVQATLRGLS